EYAHMVRNLTALNHNLLLLKYDDRHQFGKRERIDIWWGGLDHNGELMLLCAWLISTADEWRRAEIHIHVVVPDESHRNTAAASLERIISDSRVKATANIQLRSSKDKSMPQIIGETSGESDLVIMGLRAPDPTEADNWVTHVNHLLQSLRTVLLVRASGRFEGADVLFDEE
ncbi:MAG: hypothetical protein JXX29_24370, partial [Deltaproteobacteria bacterium]|nr:hypothetical protein [Deltaproteobacteria bacterium]